MSTELTGITHHTAELNGIKQHWVSAGQGPPVYLLHGFPRPGTAGGNRYRCSPSGSP
ncbi:hypothetical protein SAZ11_03950 [Streptomyces sp. FXJ1.4098]|nr:hypothetical protein [Streptomyces sp. FXJ1.4098]